MSLLGGKYQEVPRPPEKADRNASFKCPACGKVEKQPKTVSEVMHRCPKDNRMRTLKREET